MENYFSEWDFFKTTNHARFYFFLCSFSPPILYTLYLIKVTLKMTSYMTSNFGQMALKRSFEGTNHSETA